MAGVLGVFPGVTKAIANRLIFGRRLAQIIFGKIPTKTVKEVGLLNCAKRTALGALNDGCQSGCLFYRNTFAFGLYDDLKSGKSLSFNLLHEHHAKSVQESYRGAIFGVASGGALRGFLPYNRV